MSLAKYKYTCVQNYYKIWNKRGIEHKNGNKLIVNEMVIKKIRWVYT